ncbi:MAG TPA: hypothetical protein VMK16_16460, partial [Acidimicrobiales bacterium]|nr:hypothetical protein [Acidimicrobiales bacterium]
MTQMGGFCAAARIAAGWRLHTIGVDDQRIVRRAAIVCGGGIAVTVLGWTIALMASNAGVRGAVLTGVGVMAIAAFAGVAF